MEEKREASGGAPWSGRWLRVWIVTAAIFTALMINYSMRHGRLLMAPWEDDVSYLCDALQRIQTLDKGSLPAFASEFVHTPPHSPLITLMAMGSYLVLGRHDWAPYASCGLIVLGVLMAVDFIMRQRRPIERLGAAALALCVPMVGLSVIEFRPDLACGLTTAMAMLLLCTEPLAVASLGKRLVIGGLVTIALLFKPSISPATITFAATGFLIQIALGRLAYQISIRAALRWRVWLPAAAPVVLIAVPQYVVSFHEIAHYIWAYTLGPGAGPWDYPGTLWQHLTFYPLREGRRMMLGWYFWPLAALMIGETAWIFFQSDRRKALQWLCLLAITFVAYAIPTAALNKSPFFGLTFYFLLLFGAMIALRDAFSLWQTSGWPIRGVTVVAWLLIVAAISRCAFPAGQMERWLGYSLDPHSPKVQAINRVAQGIYDCIPKDLRGRGAHVYFTATGFSDDNTLRYYGLMNGNLIDAEAEPNPTNLAGVAANMELANFVVASEPGNGLINEKFPPYGHLAETLAVARSLRDLRLIATIPAMNGKRFFVFARNSQFFGFAAVDGLNPEEGPYPTWNLPQVRWGLLPESKLDVSAVHDGTFKLKVSALHKFADQRIDVIVNGQHQATWEMTNQILHLSNYSCNLPLHERHNLLELRYSQPPQVSQHETVVLFSRIEISEPGSAATMPSELR